MIRKAFILMYIGLFSCVGTPNIPDNLYANFSNERSLKADSKVNLGVLSNPGAMIIRGNKIIFQVYQTSHNFEVFDFSGNILNKLVPFGKSPNESLWANMINSHKDDFLACDVNLKEILIIDKADLLDSKSTLKRKRIILPDNFNFSNITPISNSRYLLYGTDKEGVSPFLITDSLFQTIGYFGEFSKNNDQKMDVNALRLANQGTITTTWDGNFFSISSHMGNIIKFYDCSDTNKIPVKLDEYIYDIPIMENVSRGNAISVVPQKHTKVGTISTSSSDNYYYFLNIDKSLSENDNKRSSNIILVFDKKGKPIEKIILDHPASLIAYSLSDNSIYALSDNDNGEDILVRYSLESI